MNIPYLALQVAESHGRLWAINPQRAQAMAEMFAKSPEAFSAAFPPSGRDPEAPPAGIALIPLSGVMSRAGMPCTESASTIDLSRALRAAQRDESVSAIVLDIDSPGGTVAGTADLADVVAAVAKVKPVYAYVADMACSAAYWVASQATAIWASPNATAIGNIGVRAAMADTSKAYQAEGIDVTVYASGPYKAIGAEGVPIPQAHHAEMQRQVDQQALAFFDAVKKGRKLDDDALAAVTDGRWFTASESKQNGLIDRVGSLDALFQAISSRQASPGARHLSPAARPAASAPTHSKPMSKLSEFFANLRSNPEAAKAANLPDAAAIDALEAEANATPPTTTAGTDPNVLRMIEEAKAQAEAANAAAQAQALAVASTLADVEAKAFADSLIMPDAQGRSVLHNNARAAIENGIRVAAIADGGGTLKLDAQGKLVMGSNVAAFKDAFKAAPRAIYGGDTIPDSDPSAEHEGAEVPEARRVALLKKNPVGAAMLAKETKN